MPKIPNKIGVSIEDMGNSEAKDVTSVPKHRGRKKRKPEFVFVPPPMEVNEDDPNPINELVEGSINSEPEIKITIDGAGGYGNENIVKDDDLDLSPIECPFPDDDATFNTKGTKVLRLQRTIIVALLGMFIPLLCGIIYQVDPQSAIVAGLSLYTFYVTMVTSNVVVDWIYGW